MFARSTLAAVGVAAVLSGSVAVAGLAGPAAPALAALIGGDPAATAYQQTPTSPSPVPKAGRGRGPESQLTPEQRQQRHQQFMDRVAANLGVTPAQLQDAFKKARIDQVNQAVAEGRVSQEQANRMIERINTGQGFKPHGPGDKPNGPGQRGQGPDGRQAMRGGLGVAAEAIGITPEQLRQELRSGKSLAQVAQERGVSRDTLKQRILAAQQQRLDQAVQQGRMTREQATQVMNRLSANIDRMLDFTPGQRPDGRRGAQ
jgi:predicted DNA-binding protein (UPF0251 family)